MQDGKTYRPAPNYLLGIFMGTPVVNGIDSYGFFVDKLKESVCQFHDL